LPLRQNIFLKSLKSRVVFNAVLRGIVMRLGLQSMTICGVSHGVARETNLTDGGV
jgi:hypothetical protein